jgi:hypothetical protein
MSKGAYSHPDETTGAGLVLGLGKAASVSTCMLLALDAQEFKGRAREDGITSRHCGTEANRATIMFPICQFLPWKVLQIERPKA